MRRFRFTIFILLVFAASCENAANFPIDDKPLTKIDSGYLGIWKVREDTDKANFIFIQTSCDDHESSKYISDDKDYCITYFNHRGYNPLYEQWTTFISIIEGNTFFNCGDGAGIIGKYFFVRVLPGNAANGHIMVATVADTTLKYLKSAHEVRDRIVQRINTPSFYKDTLHLYKVSNYHGSLNTTVSIANEGNPDWDVDTVSYNGNQFKRQLHGFSYMRKRFDPFTDSEYKTMITLPEPITMNGEKIYDMDEIDLSSQNTLKKASMGIKKYLLDKFRNDSLLRSLPDGTVHAYIAYIVIDKKGKGVLYYFNGIRYLSKNKMPRLIDDNFEAKIGNWILNAPRITPATLNSKKVIVRLDIPYNYDMEIRNHIIKPIKFK